MPRHVYDYDVDPNSSSAPARVIRMIGRGRRVLELGCGPGSITRHLASRECAVTALERDPSSLTIAKPFCESIYEADLNADDWYRLVADRAPFEVVLAADVLEHLYDPAATLRRMASLAGVEGQVVLSLPHVGHSVVHACLFSGNFEYRDWGLLDRTHIRFFGLANMQSLVESCGLKIVESEFVSLHPGRTEFARAWRRLPKVLRRELARSPHGDIYQVVLKAINFERPGSAISLQHHAAATASHRQASFVTRLTRRLGVVRAK